MAGRRCGSPSYHFRGAYLVNGGGGGAAGRRRGSPSDHFRGAYAVNGGVAAWLAFVSFPRAYLVNGGAAVRLDGTAPLSAARGKS